MNKGFNSDLPETGIEVRAKENPFISIPEEQIGTSNNAARTQAGK